MQCTLGAQKKMFYDSKMFLAVPLSPTPYIYMPLACPSRPAASAHDRPALALPALRGYHALGYDVAGVSPLVTLTSKPADAS